jgi:ubiquinone/menaquinone biosynthesis C-methylase UbiE
MADTREQRFWNRIAQRYAARPLKNPAAYEAMLADVTARLGPQDRVLEIGCGTGGTAIRLAAVVADCVASDFSTEMIRIAQAKPAAETVRFIVADAGQALEHGPFDVVCAFNVLHLVDDLPDTLSRIHGALTPGGQLISKTWCFAELAFGMRALFALLRMIGLFPKANMLTEPALRQAILAAGFEIVDQRQFGTYPQNPYIVARKPQA